MKPRELDRRRGTADLYFADDAGCVEPDRRQTERRGSPRYQVHLWADQAVAPDAAPEVLHVIELSLTGCFVIRTPPLELGDVIELRFTLPMQTQPIEVVGRVASQRLTPDNPASPSGYGVAFTGVDTNAAVQIKGYLEWVAGRQGQPHPLAQWAAQK